MGEKYKRFGLYPNGVVQPGVLCMKPDKTILYQWAIIPSEVRKFANRKFTDTASEGAIVCMRYSRSAYE